MKAPKWVQIKNGDWVLLPRQNCLDIHNPNVMKLYYVHSGIANKFLIRKIFWATIFTQLLLTCTYILCKGKSLKHNFSPEFNSRYIYVILKVLLIFLFFKTKQSYSKFQIKSLQLQIYETPASFFTVRNCLRQIIWRGLV